MTRKIGLNKYVLLSINYEVVKAREKNEKIQCDIFEAFIAALLLDSCGIAYNDIGKLSILTSLTNLYDICKCSIVFGKLKQLLLLS